MCKTHTLLSNQVAYNSLFGNDPISKNNTLGLATYGLMKVTGLVNTATDKDFTFENSKITYQPDFPAPTGSAAAPSISRVKLGDQQAFIGKYASVYVQVKTTMTNAGSGFNLAATVTPTNEVLKVYSSELTLADTNVIVSTNGTNVFKLFADRGFVSKIDYDTSAATTAGTKTKFYYNDQIVSVLISDVLPANLEDYSKSPIGAKTGTSTISSTAADLLFKAMAKKGNVVQISDLDNDGYADVVYVTEYTAAKVTRVTKDNITFSVNFDLNGTPTRIWKFDDMVGADDLKVDDYAYGYVDSNGKLLLQIPTTVDVKITSEGSASANNIKADGKTYDFAGFTTLSSVSATAIDPTNEVTLFLDAYGYIVAADLIDAQTSIAYVLNIDDLSGVAPQVRLLLTDGTTVVGRIDEAYNGTTKVITGTAPFTSTAPVVKYSVSDAGYKITTVISTTLAAGTDIVPKVATIGSVTGILASDSTVYVDGKGKTTYTGYKNIPTFDMTSPAKGAVYVKDTDTTATYVFVVDAANTKGLEGQFVVYSLSSGYQKGDKVYTLNVLTTNGIELKTFDLTSAPLSGLAIGHAYLTDTTKTVDGNSDVIATLKGTGVNFRTGTGGTIDGSYKVVAGNIDTYGAGVVRVGTTNFQITSDTMVYEIEVNTAGTNYTAVDVGTLNSYKTDEVTHRIGVIYKEASSGTSVASIIVVFKGEISLAVYTGVGTFSPGYVAPATAAAAGGCTVAAPVAGAITKDAVTYTGGTYTFALGTGSTVVGVVTVTAATGAFDIAADVGNVAGTTVVIDWTYTDGIYSDTGSITVTVTA